MEVLSEHAANSDESSAVSAPCLSAPMDIEKEVLCWWKQILEKSVFFSCSGLKPQLILLQRLPWTFVNLLDGGPASGENSCLWAGLPEWSSGYPIPTQFFFLS